MVKLQEEDANVAVSVRGEESRDVRALVDTLYGHGEGVWCVGVEEWELGEAGCSARLRLLGGHDGRGQSGEFDASQWSPKWRVAVELSCVLRRKRIFSRFPGETVKSDETASCRRARAQLPAASCRRHDVNFSQQRYK